MSMKTKMCVNDLPFIDDVFEGDRVVGLYVSDCHHFDQDIEWTIVIDVICNEGSDEEFMGEYHVIVPTSYDYYENDTKREMILRYLGIITEREYEEEGYDVSEYCRKDEEDSDE